METSRRRLGAGRSGEVFLDHRPDGPAAVKVFLGDPLADLVHYGLSGAPNPYVWDEHAVRAVLARRTVVRLLCQAWFGERLDVSAASEVAWNDEARSWELVTEFVPGQPVRLLHPLRDSDPGLDLLRHEVMAPLQDRLDEAGLDGVVWQAGRGNPVALSNFLQVDDERFALIDVESGVPALFPADPRELVRFYLPRTFRHRHPLFDDVDVPRLRGYLADRVGELQPVLGPDRWDELCQAVDQLEEHQRRWHARDRVERAVAYQLGRGRLSQTQAEHYLRHRWRFRAREVDRVAGKSLHALACVPGQLDRWLFGLGWSSLLRNAWGFVSSQEHRTALAAQHVENRVEAWRERGQLDPDDADAVLDQLEDEGSSTYLTDFGAHLGLKATFQLAELTLLTLLVALGLVPVWLVAVVVALDGVLYRTLYTLYRSVREILARRRPPWLALLVGLLPLVGNLAFPAQMVWSAKEREELVARFLVTDLFTRLGTRLPIWGGEDTLTEHLLNRAGHRLVRRPALT
jgi:hypothetical protein